MKEKSQRKLYNVLSKKGIKNFVGVPDSTIKYFIDEGLNKKKILISTREEEAIGIATGMSLSGEKSLVFMQNAGFANSLSTITSLVQLYQIPIILLIGWRGFLKNDAPEHEKIGKIQPQLIKTIGLESKIVDEKNLKNTCDWALTKLNQGKSIGLIIKREFID
ncbi:thiamine pyrophosphate-binding protein [Nitrosopumilus sp.]|uniref:thiamine pyrophosphate-binding protein n=1 Tax=Nitrosopumilus sp. TaxID=2024843 RepID=UPI003D0B6B22